MANLIIAALAHVWQVLGAFNAPMAVAGGIAVGIWKCPRSTHDVDLLIAIEPPDLKALLAALGSAGMLPRTATIPVELGDLRMALLSYEPPGSYLTLHINLLFADSEYHRQALSRVVPVTIPDGPVLVNVLSCEDLILLKLLAGRLIDQADVVSLLQANIGELDRTYLADWARRMGVFDHLAELWIRALPQEAPL